MGEKPLDHEIEHLVGSLEKKVEAEEEEFFDFKE